MTAPSDERRLLAWTVGLSALALLWRARLTGLYFGSEEEDYGNLGLILGTLDSGFRYVETEHMPLFTALAAAVTGLVGDAEVGGEIVAVISGVAVVALTLRIGWRWLSPAAGVVAAGALVFQPDLALYSATPLRITTYVALVLLGVYALGERRTALAAVALPLAFLTRFDLAFSILPAAVLLAAARSRDPDDRRAAWIPVAVVIATVLGWAAWYHHELGTWRFWGGVAERNEGSELGLGTLVGFVAHIVPSHLGRLVSLASLLGAVMLLRGRAAHPARGRWLLLAGSSAVGLLTTTLLLSSYDWNHNLYWKWLCTSIPFLVLGAAHAGVEVARSRPGRLLPLVLAGAFVIDTGLAFRAETSAQLDRSDRWYGTQVRLMDWVEAEFPDDVGVLGDLIPATYLSRRHSPRRVHLWRQSDLPAADEEAFARYLRKERISLVFWFREEWVGAHRAAPWLADPEPKIVGGVRLLPIAAEDGYGFVAWQVLEPGLPDAANPPPADAGATPFVRATVAP